MHAARKAVPILGSTALGLTTLVALGLAVCPQSAQAQAYSFTTFNAPNAANTFAHGISNSGQIVGRYDSSVNATTSGFSANVGSLTPSGFNSYSTGDAFSEFDAVNSAGQIAGDYVKNSDGSNPGFLLNGSTRSDFNPAGTITAPAGINTSGAVSGTTFDANSIAQGFVRSAGGAFTFFSDPKASSEGTFGTGINDAGTTVGYYINGGGYFTAFVDKNSVFTDLSISSTFQTIAYAVNNGGDIVGSYQTPGTTAFNPSQGFLLLSNGTLITLNVPNSVSTEIFGVNDSRQVVGDYKDAAGIYHGFLATPAPEPSGWAVLGLGVLGVSVRAVRARRRAC